MAIPGRNADPVIFLDAVPADDGTTVRLADGREFLDANMAFHEKDIERMRTGWVCIRCYEPQSEAFPVVCESKLPNGASMCGFPMREMQASEFAIMFKGTVKLGSSINVDDEIARLDEFDDYERRTGIKIPDSVRYQPGKI